MGVLKKYQAGISLENLLTVAGTKSANSFNDRKVAIQPFKNTNNETINYVRTANSTSSIYLEYLDCFFPYTFLTASASSDTLGDFDKDSIAINAVGTTTQSVIRQADSSAILYNLVITNSSDSDIIVNSIKFIKKDLYYYSGNDLKYSTFQTCGYFLDTSLTISAGGSANITVALSFGE